MTEDVTKMNATDSITLIEGCDETRIFLEMALLHLGKADEEIDLIVAGLKWADGAPIDPMMWKAWLAAVQIACVGRTHQISSK